ncbi:MAG: LuxR C-terminal-related transcriptional regulator [Raoultibacter sp.]
MGEVGRVTEPQRTKTPGDLLNTYILAAIGFSCLLGWELSAVFSPSLSLLSFCDLEEAMLLRIISLFTLAGSFVFFYWKEDWLFEHRNKLCTIGSLLALFAVLNTMANLSFEWVPFGVSILAWALFGIAQASIMMYWCIFFSLIPTRGTAVTVAVGSCGGTALFVFSNASGVALLDLFEITFLIVGSVGLAAFLSTRIAPDRILPVKEYRRSALLTIPAALSVGCHGVVYGFMAVMMTSMGPTAALICGASGIFGTLAALLWAYLGPKVEIDTGVVQRISLPFLVAGVLLMPFFGEVGRIVCGSIINVALAHASVIAWYSTSIDNAEFGLHPVDRFSMRQAPNWIGFLIGSIAAFLVVFVLQLTEVQFYLFMVGFATIVVIVFSVYGGDESKTKRRLNDLMTTAESVVEEEPKDEGAKPAQYFRQRVDKVIEDYGLTPREAEVFYLLAKGRNAEYIGNQLVVSSATVKSHIYHIYRKLGINSQQRLMTIVDDETQV